MRRLSFAPLASTLILAAALSGCIPATTPPQVPPPVQQPPRPAPEPRPVLGADWRDWPLTPGDWRYQRTGQGSTSTFGVAGAPRLILSCDLRNRTVRLNRPGSVAGAWTIRTSSTVRNVAAQAGASGAELVLAGNDRLLDAMAFSRGRFTIEQAGQPPLIIPAYAEVGRVIEDCRG